MEQPAPKDEGGKVFFTLACHKTAQERTQSRRIPLPERRCCNGTHAMLARLIEKFRRWIGYRPERRYMRGGAR
ncbi:MAG: hypothetical protein K5Q68_20905 [Roseococcus sp.]|nr:hypothetical protein [Roseococcus sp.]